MADFRRWFYAFAVVALLAGLTVPASAQGLPVTCNTNASVPTIVRAEAYADFVGDYVLSCTGGSPTTPGQAVPQVTLTIFLTTNITSKLTSGGLFDEALLIIDEPNTPGTNSARPILNCGNTGAPDSGVSGPGVCSIIAPPANGGTGLAQPNLTYDGTQNAFGALTCGTTGPAIGTYGCGRPNIFQGRLGIPQNTGQNNIVVFSGVPFDPPGTITTRTLRITNVRADAEFTGVSSTFTQAQIQMNVSFTGTTLVSVNNPQQIVAFVQRGLVVVSDTKGGTFLNNLGFLQCNTENGKLFGGTGFALGSTPFGGTLGGGANGLGLGSLGNTPTVRFQEGFNTAWKTKNIAFLLSQAGDTGNGTFTGAGYNYTGTRNYPTDMAQNVPGANYNTEGGFEWASGQPLPIPNPPTAIGTNTVSSNGLPLASVGPNVGGINTGIAGAGIASQGTRLALSFSNVPSGVNIYVPPVLYLYRQNDATGTNSFSLTGANTGVMVLTTTDANGAGAYSAATTGGNLQQVSNSLAVYEILFADPNSLEQVDVPVVVAYLSQLSANPPVGLPVPGTVAQVAGGFAPFYTTASARQPSSTLPVPRFIPGNTPLNLFEIVKCACDVLFPFVASVGGFDTGIAVANTSLDPGANFGFGATPQQGAVQFWYYGVGANGAAPPASQTSGIVPAGQVLTYVLSTGGGAIGTGANGMDNRAAGFEGYVIAQAGFQWCHAFAFISPLGGGPTANGVSEGYLGIIVDGGPALARTGQAAEIKAH